MENAFVHRILAGRLANGVSTIAIGLDSVVKATWVLDQIAMSLGIWQRLADTGSVRNELRSRYRGKGHNA